jgi:hypothetical protein
LAAPSVKMMRGREVRNELETGFSGFAGLTR